MKVYEYDKCSVLVSDEDYKLLIGLDESLKRARHGVDIYENDPTLTNYREQLLSLLWQKQISKIKYNSELKKIPNRIAFIQSNYNSFKNIISRNEEEKELILNKYKKGSFLYRDSGLLSRFRVSYDDLLRLREIDIELEKARKLDNSAYEIAALNDEKQRIYKKLLPERQSLHHYDAGETQLDHLHVFLIAFGCFFLFVLLLIWAAGAN